MALKTEMRSATTVYRGLPRLGRNSLNIYALLRQGVDVSSKYK